MKTEKDTPKKTRSSSIAEVSMGDPIFGPTKPATTASEDPLFRDDTGEGLIKYPSGK